MIRMVKSWFGWNRAIGELFPGSNTPHAPVPEIRGSELSVGRRIRTSWLAPLLYAPRTTGTFPPPPPRGDESDTQAATPRMVDTTIHVPGRRSQSALGNGSLHRSSQLVQRALHLGIAVSGRHEARLKWRWRQVHSSLESGVKESAK